MERVGNYELKGQMSNKDSGYSLWCFCDRDGQEYFIKEFLSPKYPYEDTVSSPARIQKKIKRCEEFETQKRHLYHVLNRYSDGNSVRVRDFFRVGNKYYVVTPKVDAKKLPVSAIVGMPEVEKRRLCAIIAHSVACFHRGGLIHADLKPTNILFTQTASGNYTAKIIDFDSSFLESEAPGVGEEIVGDQVYFSPEACMMVCGIEAPLTCKMDVFALGILFHQYFTGTLPGFDTGVAAYTGEAVAKGCELKLSPDLPKDVRLLLSRMLDPDPKRRPDAVKVFLALRPKPEEEKKSDTDSTVSDKSGPIRKTSSGTGKEMDKWFSAPSDLS